LTTFLTTFPPGRRIGLYGGSFDPVHNAHLALAAVALDQLGLDELRWVPAGQPWQKMRRLAAAEHRLAMLALALQGEPRYTIDRCEIDRSGPSYTIDTVQAMQAAEPGAQWFLLIGGDQFAGLHTWHRWTELLQRVTLAVAARPGALPEVDPAVAQAARVMLQMPPSTVSSTDIRRIAAAGSSSQGLVPLVPAAVAGYIDLHHLYRGNTGS
jgi:nicotinate-nucleotide adenylyltransferase